MKPAIITVHERELDNVPEQQRHQIRPLQRAYAEEWTKVLCQLHPEVPGAAARAAVHATIGLHNSTPGSASEHDGAALAALLDAMAARALPGC